MGVKFPGVAPAIWLYQIRSIQSSWIRSRCFSFSHSRISVSVPLGCLHMEPIDQLHLALVLSFIHAGMCMYDTNICHIPAFKLDPSIAKLRRLQWSKVDCGAFCGSKVNQRTLVMLHSVAIFSTLKSETCVPLCSSALRLCLRRMPPSKKDGRIDQWMCVNVGMCSPTQPPVKIKLGQHKGLLPYRLDRQTVNSRPDPQSKTWSGQNFL